MYMCRNDPEINWLPQSMYYALNGSNSAVMDVDGLRLKISS